MKDGDAHPEVIEEVERIFNQGGKEIRMAIGSLVSKRHEILDKNAFGGEFDTHNIVSGRTLYSVNIVGQHKGLVAVFENHDDTLRLLAVVPFANFIYEWITGNALKDALRLAQERYST